MIESKKSSSTHSIASFFRMNFMLGLVLILPVVATIWLVVFSVRVVSQPLSLLIGQESPMIISFVLTLVIITLLGFVASNFIGRTMIDYFDRLVVKIPVIGMIYRSSKQVISAFSFNNRDLLSAVLVEYPRSGTWALAYVTSETVNGLTPINKENTTFDSQKMVSLFVPTTPNPTSGYLIYVNESDIVRLDMSVEESIRLLMSAGVLSSQQASQ